MKFKLGDIVKLKEDSDYYYQAPNLKGKITTTNVGRNPSGVWHRIKWIDEEGIGETIEDNYLEEDLILCNSNIHKNLLKKLCQK